MLSGVIIITHVFILSKRLVHITVLRCVQNNTAGLLKGVAMMHIL